MSGSEQFTVGLHKPQPQPQQPPPQQLQNLRLDFAADGVYKPAPTYHTSATVAANINGGESSAATVPPGLGLSPVGGSSTSEPMKRKRGRPRKYGPDGTMSLALTTTTTTTTTPPSVPGGSFSPAATSASASPGGSTKKGRGRPRGSLNKTHSKPKGSTGSSFMPHVITIKAGEDLASKIMALSQNMTRHICILAANGSISNVTLHQPASSGGTVTYEGKFEILSLGGSFFLPENGSGQRIGGLNVSLSGPDGRVLGGGVAGLLIAASPVQVVLGSFATEGHKGSKTTNEGNQAAQPKVSTAGQSSSPSRGTLSESSGGPGSPLNPSTGNCNSSNPQGIPGIPWK